MRKTILLFTFICATMVNSFAADWNDSFALPRPEARKNTKELLAPTADGALFAAGVFTTDLFEFGTSELEAISGGSTYLIKYSDTGEKLWGVSFFGASTPTAITLDTQGNVYIAGNYTGEVTFNTRPGATAIVKAGAILDDNTIVNGGFIAKYNADGVIMGVETFLPTPFTEGLGGFMSLFAPQFSITQLQIVGDQLYASALHTCLLTKNGIEINGALFLADFSFDMDAIAGSLITLDPQTLAVTKLVTTITQPANLTINNDVQSLRFDVTPTNIYLGAVGERSQEIVIGGNVVATLDLPIEGENWKQAYIVVKLSADGVYETSTHYDATVFAGYKKAYSVAGLRVIDNQVVLGGNYEVALPFNTGLEAPVSDLYIATLSASDLSVVSAIASGSTAAITAFGTAVTADGMNVYGNGEVTSAILNSKSVEYLAEGKNILGMAVNGTKLANSEVQRLGEEQLALSFSIKTIESTGISTPNSATLVSVYPNPVVDVLNISELADVTIYNPQGAIVYSSSSVTTVPVSHLSNGLYTVVVTTNGNTESIKIIKK